MNGIPSIAWPLFAEQRMNAVVLSDGIRVAIRPQGNENGLVEKEEIGRVVRRLIEGDEGRQIRERMKKIKEIRWLFHEKLDVYSHVAKIKFNIYSCPCKYNESISLFLKYNFLLSLFIFLGSANMGHLNLVLQLTKSIKTDLQILIT